MRNQKLFEPSQSVLSLIFITLFAQSAFAATPPIAIRTGTVEFTAIGKPQMVKIHGSGEGLSGSVERSTVTAANGATVSFKLSELKTGIGLRDSHMKEKYLEVTKFPEAVLTLKSFKVPDSETELSQQVDGLLRLHGVEKPVKVDVKSKKTGATFSVSSQFKIKLSDFGIETPSYLGVKVADVVEVKVEAKGE